jgi:hypothetical protein
LTPIGEAVAHRFFARLTTIKLALEMLDLRRGSEALAARPLVGEALAQTNALIDDVRARDGWL